MMTETEREEKVLWLLMMEEGAMSQGMFAASRSGKVHGNQFFPGTSRRKAALPSHISFLTSGTIR